MVKNEQEALFVAKKYYITAAKGGAGATTVATGLGFALAARGESTLIVDGDSSFGCGLTVCGCEGMQVFTLADYARGACRAKQTVVRHPKYNNLYIMSALGCTDASAVCSAVRETEGLFDFILCDGTALAACSEAIVVTEPYTPSIKAADGAVNALRDGGKLTGVIVNKVNGGLIVGGATPSPEDIAAALGVELIASLPEDLALTVGIWRTYSKRYYRAAAAALCGRKIKTPRPEAGYTGAGGYFRRRLRGRV